MTDSPFCSGHVRLIDETILIVGGDNLGTEYEFQDGRYSVRRFVPGSRPFYNTTDYMQPYFNASVDPNSGARWYPTLLTMVDNNVLIVSGATTDGEALHLALYSLALAGFGCRLSAGRVGYFLPSSCTLWARSVPVNSIKGA